MADWQHAKLLGRKEVLDELKEEAEHLPRTPVRVRKWIEAKLATVERSLEIQRRDTRERHKVKEWERENRQA